MKQITCPYCRSEQRAPDPRKGNKHNMKCKNCKKSITVVTHLYVEVKR